MSQYRRDLLKKQLKFWKDNPKEFFRDCWPKFVLWPKLVEIVESVRDRRGTVVPSGHGVGKTAVSGRIVLWWLVTRYPSKVITTAPTWGQVESVLWSEIRQAVIDSRVPLLPDGAMLQTEINLQPEWFAKGVSTNETVTMRQFGSTKFQGYHSPNLLVVMDEAPGVDHSIHIALESLATGSANRILKIGNPTSPTGEFYRNCTSGLWKKIPISCFDHPNVIGGREIIAGAVTKEWIERAKEQWGEESPLYVTKVLGGFPSEGEQTLFPMVWMDAARSAIVEPSDQRILAVDVARFGDDRTVLAECISNEVNLVSNVGQQDTMKTVGRIVKDHERWDKILVDEIGVGGGVVDRLMEVLEDKGAAHKVMPVNVAVGYPRAHQFMNLRMEMMWYLRECLRPDGIAKQRVRLPQSDELMLQLATIRYEYASDGRMKVESKDDAKKRGVKSPDIADAVAMAVWGAHHSTMALNRSTGERNLDHDEFYRMRQEAEGNASVVDVMLDHIG